MKTTTFIINLDDSTEAQIEAMLPNGHTVFDVRYVNAQEDSNLKCYETTVEVDHGVERDCWREWVSNVPGVTLNLAK